MPDQSHARSKIGALEHRRLQMHSFHQGGKTSRRFGGRAFAYSSLDEKATIQAPQRLARQQRISNLRGGRSLETGVSLGLAVLKKFELRPRRGARLLIANTYIQ